MDEEERLARGSTEHYRDAALYDFEYDDRTVDLRWYRRLASERLATGATLLELGAGTGRITCALAKRGYGVIALDAMPTMLERLRERLAGRRMARRVQVIRGDMRAIPCASASVPMVIAPFNSLSHLYTWQDLLTCFREVHRVLAPGGVFAFDVHLPDPGWLALDSERRHFVTPFRDPQTGERRIWSTNHRYDTATQIVHIRIYYDDAPPPGRTFVPPARPRRVVHLTQRQIFPEEVRALIDAAGLCVESHGGDFREGPLSARAGYQSVVCLKPARSRDASPPALAFAHAAALRRAQPGAS